MFPSAGRPAVPNRRCPLTEPRPWQLPADQPPPSPAARGWLVGPWFDLLFIANIGWPLVLLAQVGDDFDGHSGLQFWQVYYVTTPHRWVTLLLVFADRDRFRPRRWTFLFMAVTAVALCLGVQLTTGELTCLLAVDYVWNAWHFAAQHHGVYRIFGRVGGVSTAGVWAAVEKWGMRGFLLYVILRIANVTWAETSVEETLRTVDWLVLLVPTWLVVRELTRTTGRAAGRVAYITSVCILYTALLWAVHDRRPGLVLTLATASALFHAIEYLSVVGWSVRKRHADKGGQLGMLAYLAPRWGLTFGVFALILGAGGWLMDQEFAETWLFLNVVVAFLHYAYDGMIWHRRSAS